MVGLTAEDHVGPAPRMAGCGLDFPYLLGTPGGAGSCGGQRAGRHRPGVVHVSVFAWDPAERTARTRVFVPGLGVPEDPATGSAALGFGVWLVTSGLLPEDGESAYTVIQGVEMGRPSTMTCTITASGGVVTDSTVTGSVVPIARGEIVAPPL